MPTGSELIVITGPTGVGKSRVAVEVARLCGGEIVNCDSIQIYRGFDLGSAKPSPEVRAAIPHHLYDFIEPDRELNAADYAREAARVCEEIEQRGRRSIVVGGAGFYLRALLSGLPSMPGRDQALRERLRTILASERGRSRLHRWLVAVDPASGMRIAPGDRHRIERALEVWITTGRPISSWKAPTGNTPRRAAIRFALSMDRARLREELNRRVDRMYELGLVRETAGLLERYPRSARPFEAIGYRECVRFLDGEIGLEVATEETKRRTRQYSKRQMTWLRSESGIHWIGMDAGADVAVTEISEILGARV